MFSKLVKYEWTAMIRAMLPVYVATLAISVINSISLNSRIFNSIESFINNGFFINFAGFMQAILGILYVVVLIGLFIMTFIVTVQRFYKGLLRNEGYLMFTLPVKVSQLTASKALVSFFISILSVIVAIFAILILGGADTILSAVLLPGEIIFAVSDALSDVSPAIIAHIIFYVIELILAVLASIFGGIYTLYASMALGQLSRNHKIGFSVLWYILISIAESLYAWLVIFGGMLVVTASPLPYFLKGSPVASLHILFMGVALLNIIPLIAYVLITDLVLGKRLNLE